jgi:hypothetical protein
VRWRRRCGWAVNLCCSVNSPALPGQGIFTHVENRGQHGMRGIGRQLDGGCRPRPPCRPVSRRFACLPVGSGHDLAPVSRDIRRASAARRRNVALDKRMIWRMICSSSTGRSGLSFRCGTLTYRQTLQVRRQPYGGIAAAQQTKVRNGARRCGGNRNEPIGRPLRTGPGERRAAALSQDVLGNDAAIGLIRFVRSASSRG